MLRDVNKGLGSPLAEQTLNDVFDLAWPKLEAQLSALPKPETTVPPKRSLEDMVAQIMDTSRTTAKVGQELQEQVAHVQRVLDRAPFGDNMMSLLQANVDLFPSKVEWGNVASFRGSLKDMAGPNRNNEAEKDQEGQKGNEEFRLPSSKKKK